MHGYVMSSACGRWDVQCVEVLPGTQHVHLSGLAISFCRGTGVIADGVSDVVIDGCNLTSHGAAGAFVRGARSGVQNSVVRDVGCRGITVHAGNMRTLEPGHAFATANEVSHFAQYKRTYQSGIHWGGVANTYAHNTVRLGPHNCMLGGGNEVASDMGGVGNVFEYNVFEQCAYESSDTGAFYSCGQQATAYANPGNELRHNTFRDIVNTEGSGVQGITIQAVYLDDQMSSWHVWNNTFVNCTTGTFVGGGRLNSVHDNYYESCGTAHHFDNRGMGWERGSWNCTGADKNASAPCVPRSGTCTCNQAGLEYEMTGPAGDTWRRRWPALLATLTDSQCVNEEQGSVPCYNVVANNTYCKTAHFIDASAADVAAWHSTLSNNSEVPCRPRA